MKPLRVKGKTPPRKPGRKSTLRKTDPVEVCARVRNLTNKLKGSCIEVLDPTTLRLTGPAPDYKQLNCKFTQVYSEVINQKILFDNVVNPMIDDLLAGKNGLLFTYGVTSSGKTYTMTGDGESPGFLPRALDMLFNSLEGLKASKYVFIPDGVNSFQIQSEVDAMSMRQENDLQYPYILTSKTPSKNKFRAVNYDIEYTKSLRARKDHRYAVFVSYVEIYNNFVYDLLAENQTDAFNRAKAPQSLRLREDRSKNVFVYNAKQVEVRNTEEAIEVLTQGQQQKKVSSTALNAESSRSHSIFNIRVVQIPLDPMGEDILQETSLLRVSQLSLVDLAGSERSSRTGVSAGAKLREAGNINSSLMTLRRCLDQLRINQNDPNRYEMVKYRNSKLTHLFQSYFEGRGKIKMVVCINPNMSEFDENVHVMQFAETARQVEVIRSDEYNEDQEQIKMKLAAIKAEKSRKELEKKRKLKQMSQESVFSRLYNNTASKTPQRLPRNAIKKSSRTNSLKSDTSSIASIEEVQEPWVDLDFGIVDELPDTDILESTDDIPINDLVSALTARIKSYKNAKKDFDYLGLLFRKNLQEANSQSLETKSQLAEVKRKLSFKTKQVEKNQQQIRKLESKNQVLTTTTLVFEKDKQQLQDQLHNAEIQVKSSQKEVRKMDKKMKGVVANVRMEVQRECEANVRNAKSEMQEQIWEKDARLERLKNAVFDKKSPVYTQEKKLAGSAYHTPVAKPRVSYVQQRSARKPVPRGRENLKSNYHQRRSKSAETLLSSNKLQSSKKTSNEKTGGLRTRFASQSSVKSHQENDVIMQRNMQKIKHAVPEVAVASSKNNRKSSKNGNWLEHRPDGVVQTDTIFQPRIRPEKVVHVPSPKDVAKSSNYLLTHQSENTKGELTTQLVKGEVYKTATGGQQVRIVDIETLNNNKCESEKQPVSRKRRSQDNHEGDWTDVETRCSYGISNKQTVVHKKTKK